MFTYLTGIKIKNNNISNIIIVGKWDKWYIIICATLSSNGSR